MIDVLLAPSYHLFYDPKQVRKMQPYPPLGALYAAALLRQQGFSAAIFDTMLEEPACGFPAALARHKPKVVAIYEDNFNFLSKMCLTRMREVAFGMLDAARAMGAMVVANGSDSSDHAETYLRHGFDFVLLGEAERTLLSLVQAFADSLNCARQPHVPKDALETIPGLVFFDHTSGSVVQTRAQQPIRDLDTLPFPARDLIDVDHYRKLWKSAHGVFSLNAVASRGCPFRCNWCAKPIYGSSFHTRSAENVAQEMQTLKDDFGAEHVWFADDIFALKPKWPLEFAGAVRQRNAVLPFKMQTRVDLLTPHAVNALRQAGCAEVWMGIESGSQRILDAMEKGTHAQGIPAVRENLRHYGIRACFFLQFGYPGETWEDIQETIKLVRQTEPDDIGVSVAYPLPGTAFYNNVHEQLGEKTNWVDSDDLAVMFKGTYSNEFYRALRDALHAEVSSWRDPAAEGGLAACAADADRIASLWGIVQDMAKTSKNAEATFASYDSG